MQLLLFVPGALCRQRVFARVSRGQRLSVVAQAAPAKYDYDLVIIGCGVGGHGAALHAVEQVRTLCSCLCWRQNRICTLRHMSKRLCAKLTPRTWLVDAPQLAGHGPQQYKPQLLRVVGVQWETEMFGISCRGYGQHT